MLMSRVDFGISYSHFCLPFTMHRNSHEFIIRKINNANVGKIGKINTSLQSLCCLANKFPRKLRTFISSNRTHADTKGSLQFNENKSKRIQVYRLRMIEFICIHTQRLSVVSENLISVSNGSSSKLFNRLAINGLN